MIKEIKEIKETMEIKESKESKETKEIKEIKELRDSLRDVANPNRVAVISSFFKTGKGQYGEGDQFIGAYVPDIRKVAIEYKDISLNQVEILLRSSIHEERLLGLLILVQQFDVCPKEIYNFYVQNTQGVNSWDLVDLSADKIMGEYLYDKDKSLIYNLAKSKNLWERRIAIVSTFAFIKSNQFDDTLKIAEILLTDKQDLIHKAVGWMLREVGKRDRESEEIFLRKYHKIMPRTMLRYAIEHFEKEKKKFYMQQV